MKMSNAEFFFSLLNLLKFAQTEKSLKFLTFARKSSWNPANDE